MPQSTVSTTRNSTAEESGQCLYHTSWVTFLNFSFRVNLANARPSGGGGGGGGYNSGTSTCFPVKARTHIFKVAVADMVAKAEVVVVIRAAAAVDTTLVNLIVHSRAATHFLRRRRRLWWWWIQLW
jgi:hypothetical protein